METKRTKHKSVKNLIRNENYWQKNCLVVDKKGRCLEKTKAKFKPVRPYRYSLFWAIFKTYDIEERIKTGIWIKLHEYLKNRIHHHKYDNFVEWENSDDSDYKMIEKLIQDLDL